MSKEKEVSVDIKTALQFEREIVNTFNNNQVAIVDAYNAEWGRCKAVAEFLKRLFYENNNLKLYSLDIDAVLNDYESRDTPHGKKKGVEQPHDSLPDTWIPLLKCRVGLSKPYFLFYKEGKLVHEINGVNAPLIQEYVKDLCAVKVPAADFITNSRLLEVWEENFNPDESEVSWEKWLRQMNIILKLTVPLDDTERRTMLDVLRISVDAREKIVTAENLQNWFGDDDKSLLQVFTELLPGYEERAQKAILQQKEEDRIRAEKEEKERIELELRKEKEEAALLAARKQRELEEEALKASRQAQEESESSPEYISSLEKEFELVSKSIVENEQKIIETLPQSLCSKFSEWEVEDSFVHLCQQKLQSSRKSSEEHGSSHVPVLTSPTATKELVDLLANLLSNDSSFESIQYLQHVGTEMNLTFGEIVCFVHQLLHYFKGLTNDYLEPIETLAQYHFTGDANEITFKDVEGTVPAMYPRLYELLSTRNAEELKTQLVTWAPLFTLTFNPLSAGEWFGSCKADIESVTPGSTLCFPLLVLHRQSVEKSGGKLIHFNFVDGGFHGAALKASAFHGERESSCLLKPFTWCTVKAVDGHNVTVHCHTSPDVDGITTKLYEAVDKMKSHLLITNKQIKLVGTWQSELIRRKVLQIKLENARQRVRTIEEDDTSQQSEGARKASVGGGDSREIEPESKRVVEHEHHENPPLAKSGSVVHQEANKT